MERTLQLWPWGNGHGTEIKELSADKTVLYSTLTNDTVTEVSMYDSRNARSRGLGEEDAVSTVDIVDASEVMLFNVSGPSALWWMATLVMVTKVGICGYVADSDQAYHVLTLKETSSTGEEGEGGTGVGRSSSR